MGQNRAFHQTEQSVSYGGTLCFKLMKQACVFLSEADSAEAAKLLKMIGDFERISDHAVNLLESAEELEEKGLSFTKPARTELEALFDAVGEILDLSLSAFLGDDMAAAEMVEPLEQVIDDLKEWMRTRHIIRLQHGICSIDAGFVWADLLTNLERAADHCSNIAGCVIDMRLRNNAHTHEMLRERRDGSEDFRQSYRAFAAKYLYPEQGC